MALKSFINLFKKKRKPSFKDYFQVGQVYNILGDFVEVINVEPELLQLGYRISSGEVKLLNIHEVETAVTLLKNTVASSNEECL